MNKIKLTKLDGRHNGHGYFTHYVEYTNFNRDLFSTHRAWLVEKFGMSKELHDWMYSRRSYNTDTSCQNQDWCWLSNESQGVRRLYFTSNKVASYFTLCFL